MIFFGKTKNTWICIGNTKITLPSIMICIVQGWQYLLLSLLFSNLLHVRLNSANSWCSITFLSPSFNIFFVQVLNDQIAKTTRWIPFDVKKMYSWLNYENFMHCFCEFSHTFPSISKYQCKNFLLHLHIKNLVNLSF